MAPSGTSAANSRAAEWLSQRAEQLREALLQSESAIAAYRAENELMVDSRGTKVYPGGLPETLTGDCWRCRFMTRNNAKMQQTDVVELLGRVAGSGVPFIKLETLCNFDGQPGYSLGQGQ